MKKNRVFIVLVMFSILFCTVFQTSALTFTDANWQDKIADGIYEQADRKGERYLVAVWLKNIPDAEINAAVLKQTGYEVEQYEDAERHTAEVAPAIKQQVASQFAVTAELNSLTGKELEKEQQTAITEDYNQFVSAKRAVMGTLYTKQTQDFVRKNVQATDEIQFQGAFFPLVVLYATQSEIEGYAKNLNVKSINPFKNDIDMAPSSIEEQQINVDDWDGTKSTAYNNGSGYTGAGVKIGVLEYQGRFDSAAPQLSSIVGTDPENPNGKRLFFIENNSLVSPVTAVTNIHATMVTSLIVGQEVTFNGLTYEGVVPDATVYQMAYTTRLNLLNAIQVFVGMGITVLNGSFGGYSPQETKYHQADSDLDNAVNLYDISIVMASGNRTSNTPTLNVFNYARGYNVITVGNANTKIAENQTASVPYSMNVDSCYKEEQTYLTNKPDIVAPGTNIPVLLTPETYALADGTSCAAPLVAGVVAQLHQAVPSLASNPVATKAVLLAGADHSVMAKTSEALVDGNRCSYIWDKFGVGMVNAKRSVDLALNGTFASISRDYYTVTDGASQQLRSMVLEGGQKLRVVMVFNRTNTNQSPTATYYDNLDLRFSCAGYTCASSTLIYNNVEVIEYAVGGFDLYDLSVLYTMVDESMDGNIVTVSIAWIIE